MYDVPQKMAAHLRHIHLENKHTVDKMKKENCVNEKLMFKFDTCKCIKKDVFYMINQSFEYTLYTDCVCFMDFDI